MNRLREQSQKQIFVSYNDESEWIEFALRFNLGSKKNKPLKFEACRVWRTKGAPSIFAATRGSFISVNEAESYLTEQLIQSGGRVHNYSADLVARWVASFGYNRA
jgi:hypothetical protein